MEKTRKIRILFLCTGNSCRSQMAEAWVRHLKGDQIEAFSAGTAPRAVDPRAIQVMAEVGIDISAARSKHVDRFRDDEFDYVVTVCDHAKEACPIFPAKTGKVHASFEDPPQLAAEAASEEEAMGHYRRIRDEIKAFVENLPDTLF